MSVGKIRLDKIFATEKSYNMEVKLGNYNYHNQKIQLRKNEVIENIQSPNVHEDWQEVNNVPQTVPDEPAAQPFLRISHLKDKENQKDKLDSQVQFATLEEIIMFSDAFNDVIIPQPMKLVNSIQKIIRQYIKSQFKDTGTVTECHGQTNNCAEGLPIPERQAQCDWQHSAAIQLQPYACQMGTHHAYQKPNIDFIHTIDDPQTQSPKIEYMKDPFIGKLSLKVYPVSSAADTSTMARFNITGMEQDRENFQKMMTYISDYDYIPGICMLPKSIQSNLDVMMRFCIQDLLSHIPKNTISNMMFLFNKTKYANYKPDDSTISLMQQINTNGTLNDIKVLKENICCSDYEFVYYLSAVKNDITFEAHDREMFDISWNTFRMTSMAMVDFSKRLYLHKYNTLLKNYITINTIPLNDTKSMTVEITNHLVDMTKHIERQIDSIYHLREEVQKHMGNLKDLEKKLYIRVMDKEMIELEYPRTVYTYTKCTSLGKFENVLKPYNCPTKCYIDGIETAVVDHSGILEELKNDMKEKILKINEDKLKESESLEEKCGYGYLLSIPTIFRLSSKHPKVTITRPQETMSDLFTCKIWNATIKRSVKSGENELNNEKTCSTVKRKLTQKVNCPKKEGTQKKIEEIKENEQTKNNDNPKSSIKNSDQRKKYDRCTEEKKVQEMPCIQKLEGDGKGEKGLDCKSDYVVSILAYFLMGLAKLVTGIGKMAAWASIFTVLTEAVTCSFSRPSGEFVATEFLLSETTIAQEIGLPMFAFYLDRDAATINTTEITDSSRGCQLILHIEMPHLAATPGQIVFTAEHPNLGRGLQKFSMFADGRNIWKEKRLCFADCHNGVKTPLVLSATTSLAKTRNIKIIPEIRNKACKIVNNTWWSLLTILGIVFAGILLVAIDFLLLKQHAKLAVKSMLENKDRNTEQEKMMEMSI